MKKLIFCLAAGLVFLGLGHIAHAEEIKRFNVQADLAANRTLKVTESIDYDFGAVEKHGIYRNIPETYERNGMSYRLRLNFLGATMDGQPVTAVASEDSGSLNIRLGDANVTIHGLHKYALTYQSDRIINDFSDHTELYWNVTGNDWQVPIGSASFKLNAPGAPDRLLCYTGHLGSQEKDCTATSTGSKITMASKAAFEPGEGLTAVISFPLGVLQPRPWSDKAWEAILDNLWLLLPFMVLAFMYWWWSKHGKEPKGRGTVIAQYEEPQKLTPALMAALMEQKVSQKAITATILDLGRRGYLKVVFEKKAENGWLGKMLGGDKQKYRFVKTKPADEQLLAYEKTLFNGIFEDGDDVSLEDLKGEFYSSITKAKTEIFKELRDRKLFGANPIAVRAAWLTGAGCFVFIGIFFLTAVVGPAFILTAIICGIIIALFGWQMPRMTKQGAIALEECRGFDRFLSVTEKARLEFTDAPAKTPEQFARFLPAAVAFGVEDQWAGQFEGMDLEPPSYMQGPMNTWTALAMVNAVSSIHQAAASSMYAMPASTAGSGGSGFSSGGGSGGGFGGGGGGSW